MAEVNEALIRKVADLARLELKDDEIQGYVKSIGDILKHVDQLTQVKVDGVEPMYHGVDGGMELNVDGSSRAMREDVAKPFPTGSKGQPKVLEHAPDVIDGGFKVPQIL